MFKQLFDLFMDEFNKRQKRDSTIDNKVLQIIEEINELEIELAEEISDAERWGDLTDNSHWRTAEVNRIKRVIEAKRRMIDTLRQNS